MGGVEIAGSDSVCSTTTGEGEDGAIGVARGVGVAVGVISIIASVAVGVGGILSKSLKEFGVISMTLLSGRTASSM